MARCSLLFVVLLCAEAAQLGRLQGSAKLHDHTALRVIRTAEDPKATVDPKAAEKSKDETKHESGKITVGETPIKETPHLEHIEKNLRLPKLNIDHDSLSKATNGYLDWFCVIYWGTIFLIAILCEVLTKLNGGVPITHVDRHAMRTTTQRTGLHRYSTNGAMDFRSEASAPLLTGAGLHLDRGRSEAHRDDGEGSVFHESDVICLSPNFWALNIEAARGAVTTKHAKVMLSPHLVFCATVMMGLIQLFTLSLIVYDIDPFAVPFTVKPDAEWKTSPFTVNSMKMIMTFFLGMSVVAEAGDAHDNLLIARGLRSEDLNVSRFFVLVVPVFHYMITLAVIVAGVSVVLSCQAVPDILYNSMAILFITQVDELFWGFFQKVFDISVADGWQISKDLLEPVPRDQLLKRILILFPMLWGFCILGRAWYRQQMPMLVVRTLASI